jgi:4-hydroxy-2-oxoheptanedioate aldolase
MDAPEALHPRLLRQPPLVGMFSIVASIEVVEMIGLAGFDAVILDLEHGPYGVQALGPLILAARARQLAPLVRVRSNDPALVGAALDAGAAGVVAPQISGADAAAALVAAARFAPQGQRGVNPWVRAADYGAGPDWFERSNRDIAVIAMIEGRGGLESLPDILAIDGLDAVFLGPVDMAQSLGLGLQPEHPRVIETVGSAVEQAQRLGKATAVFAPTAEAARRWLARGVNFVAVSEDSACIAAALRGLRQAVQLPAAEPPGALSSRSGPRA